MEIGSLVDHKYKILDILGRGGTSCVYLAENIHIKKQWAIKEVYKHTSMGSLENGNKLIAETKILTKLSHPGLPNIVDVMETETAYLVVMEYIEGISLEKELEDHGPQSEENVVKWGKQLCDVLQYLHSQNPPIIYRDMKPSNIMLKPNGDVVLIDFGIAREYNAEHVRDTTYLGTHGYAAPEQYDGNAQSDARTDIYGLGMTLYRLLSGQDPCVPPYGIQPIKEFNKNASRHIERVIHKCTELKQDNRYQTANELKLELDKKPSKESWIIPTICAGILGVLVLVLVCVGLANKSNTDKQEKKKEDVAQEETSEENDSAMEESVEEKLPDTDLSNPSSSGNQQETATPKPRPDVSISQPDTTSKGQIDSKNEAQSSGGIENDPGAGAEPGTGGNSDDGGETPSAPTNPSSPGTESDSGADTGDSSSGWSPYF